MFEGVLPDKGEVEGRSDVKLPDFIPDKAVFQIDSEDDVDELPRGALAHLVRWDEELAYDLMVAGAGVTLLDRGTWESLAEHEDFEAEGFGVIDEEGLWLPGLSRPYTREGDGWKRPESLEEE